MAIASLETGSSPAPQPLLARLIGVISSPGATFKSVVAHPKWLGMLALAVLSAAVLMGGFLSTQVGQQAWLDQVATAADKRGGDNVQQQIQAMEKVAPYVGIGMAVAILVFIPLLYTVVAAILLGVFNVALGGNASFKQVFTVAVHTAPIGVLGQLFTLPMNYTRGTMTSATNLAVLLPMLEEDSFRREIFRRG